MKNLYFILLASIFLFACEKRKEINEWKSRAGIYMSETDYLLYQDDTYTLRAKEIQITPAGFSCYGDGDNDIGTAFNTLVKKENPKKEYEYKCTYSNVTGYESTSSGLKKLTLSPDLFIQNREFYLTFSGSKITFTIINLDGTIDEINYIKI